MGPFQNCVRQPHPPFKMAAVSIIRNLFSCPLLLYYIQLYHGGQFILVEKTEKTTELSQLADKLYRILLYRGLAGVGFELIYTNYANHE